MNKAFLDECFKARMDYLRDRFPIDDFRKCFKEQYRQNGWVMIQPTVNTCMAALMVADEQHGFIFRTQHDLDVALRLLRLWGFSVTTRRETDLHRTYTAYVVQLPDDYLKRHVGSDKAGSIRTGLRSISNVDRTKKQKGESDINVKDNGDGTMTFEVPDAVEAARNFDPYPPLDQDAVEKTFKIIYPEDVGDSEKWVLYHIVLEHSGLLTSERLVEYATDKDSEFMRREMLREFCDTLRRAWVNDMPGGTFMDHRPHVKVDYSEYVNGGKIIVEFSTVFLH